MRKNRFIGWYFKHQKANNTLAFIPGSSASGAFIQMLSPNGTQYFRVPSVYTEGDSIFAGECVFSPRGCKIDLPGVVGEIAYENITPLKSDIMGPFRFFPMKCRHGVISMSHSLHGSINANGECYSFNGGIGYIEKDSGSSFPSSYQWLQCNDFTESCSIMISIASVPFLAFHFTGCICSIIFRGSEYRMATYNGVKIILAEENQILLSQGELKLKIEVSSSDIGCSLKAPICGQMTSIITERANVEIHFMLWKRDQLLIDLFSPYATYEYVPSIKMTSGTILRSD